jgi:uncharacterized damage-inducible protein DinB
VADLKPPPLTTDERSTLISLLQFQRESFIRKVTGLSDGDARATPVESGTSLLWLTNHLADAETIWVLTRFLDRPVDPVAAEHAPTLDQAIARYRRVWDAVDPVYATTDLEQTCAADDAPAVNLRWILGHLLEETARHAGHADILRELLDGSTGR